ncbi:hypothetical protein AN641_10255 [Candidatus Epulonipiscioides gigas]|nr:hypothetical protein AN641_10255 [Epulopiscium sp. SCG-C07WGA-EpuloA2]
MRIRFIISILYLILGIMSIYTSLIIFFIPLLTLPLVKFHLNVKLTVKYIFLDIVIGILMYLTATNIMESIIYITLIICPAYSIIKAQEKKIINYPNLTFLTGTIIWGGLLLQGEAMKYYGYSYYSEYKLLINDFFGSIGDVTYYLALEELMLSIYPSTLFMSALLLSFITMSINQKRFQNLLVKQLLAFKLSKSIILISILAIIMIFITDIKYVSEIGLNLMFIVFILFYISGIWAIISYVTKSNIPPFAKLLVVIIILLLLPVIPIFPLLYGILDTIFNFRRVELKV